MFNVVEAKKKKNGSRDTRAKALNLKVMLGDKLNINLSKFLKNTRLHKRKSLRVANLLLNS